MDLTKFLLRQGGSSFRFFTLAPRSKLKPSEQLMAAMLSRNSQAEQILSKQTNETIIAFSKLVNDNELAGYVLESIYLLGLESAFRSFSVEYDGALTDAFNLVSRQAALEAIKFEKFDKMFVKFLDSTASMQDRIVWLKGIVTSRTYCYGEPAQRLSSDFDCFLDRSFLAELNSILLLNDFRVIANDNGFCNQLGVGPVGTLEDLFLVPDEELVPSAVLGYFKNRSPILDIKFNPLDCGLKMIELERFERDAISVTWRGRQFVAPGLIDQLIVSLTHLEKDRFIGWKQLLDIKLLAEKVNAEPENWKEFVRRCNVEGVRTACCAGLSLAVDRLSLAGVDHVIAELDSDQSLLKRLFVFTVTPLFYWNTSSLPMLVANAVVSDNRSRKSKILRRSFFPDRQFLSAYYSNGRPLTGLNLVSNLLLHWLVLLLPGGLVRRTFGPAIWDTAQVVPKESPVTPNPNV
ncbi:MAG: nucleotidyltransferase family protein [Cyanobacteria bacterium SZAS-4]|nr:nucleotidyltransferase family protein [Cyanobacteria bacterium SZAS-4]